MKHDAPQEDRTMLDDIAEDVDSVVKKSPNTVIRNALPILYLSISFYMVAKGLEVLDDILNLF